MREARTAAIARGVQRLTLSGAAAALVVAIAFVALVVRFPAALRGFDHRAARNAAQSPVDRLIAAADPLDIDNQFLGHALGLLPEHARYAVARPANVAEASRQGIVPTTFNALPGYVQFLLLPRRQVDPAEADWLLCYGCDLGPFRRRLDLGWRDGNGLAVGKLRR